jgi:hypothetical protein
MGATQRTQGLREPNMVLWPKILVYVTFPLPGQNESVIFDIREKPEGQVFSRV